MADEDPTQPDPGATSEAEALTRALEIELIAKRAAWQRARSQRGMWRTLSVLFLILVIGGALAAYFYFAGAVREGAIRKAPAAQTDSRP